MATILIVGDGPAGLSAALFLAKKGHRAIVYAQDRTPMHHAQLYNYLGLDPIRGSDFQVAARKQVERFGAEMHNDEATVVTQDDGRFHVRTSDSETVGDYVVLAGGKHARALAEGLGVVFVGRRVDVDGEYRTNVDRVYAVGRLARPDRSQAIISAGAGATAALDILSREAGRDVHDWDNAPEHDHDHPHL